MLGLSETKKKAFYNFIQELVTTQCEAFIRSRNFDVAAIKRSEAIDANQQILRISRNSTDSIGIVEEQENSLDNIVEEKLKNSLGAIEEKLKNSLGAIEEKLKNSLGTIVEEKLKNSLDEKLICSEEKVQSNIKEIKNELEDTLSQLQQQQINFQKIQKSRNEEFENSIKIQIDHTHILQQSQNAQNEEFENKMQKLRDRQKQIGEVLDQTHQQIMQKLQDQQKQICEVLDQTQQQKQKMQNHTQQHQAQNEDLPEIQQPDSTGKPIFLFEDNYEPNCITVFNAVKNAIGDRWNESIHELAKNIVLNKLKSVQDIMLTYNLSPNEAGAIIYWTICGKKHLSIDKKESVYKLLNDSLLTRIDKLVNAWKPYIYFLLKGLDKMPTFTGNVYRGISEKITTSSTQYFVGNHLIWITVTATSKNIITRDSFTAESPSKTWVTIYVKNAKVIESLSLYPNEAEVLLPPNTHLVVKEKMFDIPDSVDGFVLEHLEMNSKIV